MLLSGGAITTSERYRSAQDVVLAIFPKANGIVLATLVRHSSCPAAREEDMVKFRWGSALVCYATAKRGGRVTMFPNELSSKQNPVQFRGRKAAGAS